MKILVIGSGGREHAVACALSRNPRIEKMYCAPGNGGIREHAELIPVASDDVPALVEFAAGEKIDLILTDINMPVMDGLKLVSLVRQNAQLQSIPIIIITTEGAEEDRERGLALGANAYISKPIQSSHLIKTISELLSTGAIG